MPFLFCLMAVGCVPWTVAPGADPAVVFAEQTAKEGMSYMDAFVKFERTHDVQLRAINPEIHKAAEEIRKHGPGWLTELRTATKVYKANRTEGSKVAVIMAQQIVEIAIGEIKAHMAEANSKL
jgi:hypothetical protein